jgi:mannose-6-phosphate isomerase-like protein (cupin superfamily)
MTMHVSQLDDLESFITADGSGIREMAGLAGAPSAPARNQSLAEATVPVGGATAAHYHPLAEEIYFIQTGTGRMRLGDEERDVGPGDTVLIPPGVEHKISNTGDGTLRFLCCCAPAYPHADTILTEELPPPAA